MISPVKIKRLDDSTNSIFINPKMILQTSRRCSVFIITWNLNNGDVPLSSHFLVFEVECQCAAFHIWVGDVNINWNKQSSFLFNLHRKKASIIVMDWKGIWRRFFIHSDLIQCCFIIQVLLYLLCCPVLIPQRVGTLIPTDGRTVNLSLLHWPGNIRLKN